MCVDPCVTCDRARDGRIERDGCCVTDAPLSLSLSHTHTHTPSPEHLNLQRGEGSRGLRD